MFTFHFSESAEMKIVTVHLLLLLIKALYADCNHNLFYSFEIKPKLKLLEKLPFCFLFVILCGTHTSLMIVKVSILK